MQWTEENKRQRTNSDLQNTTNHGPQEKVKYNEALFTVRDTFKNRKK